MENCFLPFPVKNETKFDYIEAFEEYLMSSFDANIIDKILFNIWCHHAIQYSGLDLGKGHNPRSEGFRRILGIPTFKTKIFLKFSKFSNIRFKGFQRIIEIPTFGTMFLRRLLYIVLRFFSKVFNKLRRFLKEFYPQQKCVLFNFVTEAYLN